MKRYIILLITFFLLAGCAPIATDEGIDTTELEKVIVEKSKEHIQEEVDKQINEAADGLNEVAEGLLGKLTNKLEEVAEQTNEASAETELYKVVRVVDGDTIIILRNGTEEKIRLLMIDTPEVHGVDTPEAFGKQASAFTKNLLEGQSVQLEYDKEKYDQYERTLAYVYLEDGRMVNELLLEEGLASVVVYQPNDKYEREFRAIEKQTQKAKKGMWK